MGVAYRRVTNLFQLRLKEYDITPEQWAVLNRVVEEDGLIQKEIAERAGKDKASTTRMLDVLEAKSFLVKQPGVQDRRSFTVHATEKGRALIRETLPIEEKTMRDALEGIPEEEERLVLSVLRRIQTNLDRWTDQS